MSIFVHNARAIICKVQKEGSYILKMDRPLIFVNGHYIVMDSTYSNIFISTTDEGKILRWLVENYYC